ncbi:TauD/TfdA family dioxygenase [Vibrio sp. EA2]|uniref:TauD/TfdA family dioxygenase n=1 Tax=Vibrio sp. EA2 TaxID=3079860 RepID=UPI0029499A6E|nr:TauD/TfdA family dioxygenase [Vibrio sp. EA2]MDV6254000.1 TauD/TfdA family dioxygenase [Vibrio sp. EA2]
MPDITIIIDNNTLSIKAAVENSHYELSPLWLRERCQDENNLDKITQQRLFNPHDLPRDLIITDAIHLTSGDIRLTFSDGYQGTYKTDQFLPDFDFNDGIPAQVAWRSDIDKSVFQVELSDLETEQGLFNAIERFLTYGAIIINGVPNEPDAVTRVGDLFGHVRSTNFGQYFEVYTRPDSNDLAYRTVPLAAHTDNPYRDPMPGIQLLHCRYNETKGGLSTLVDSLSVLEQLKVECPDGYDLLTRIPVRYRHVDSNIELIERQTMIQTDYMGRISGVTYSPRLDYLPLMSLEDTRLFHQARKRLGELFDDPTYKWEFRLEPGQIQMFHNSRVLHGRTEFDANEGLRHLQGCYIDIDTPKGIYRVLKNTLNA